MELKKAVLVVSFGTSHKETREKTIEAIEADIREAFPGYEFYRAFTSPTIIRMMQSREGIQVDSVEQALERLVRDGCRQVVVQPTHVLHGFEYDRTAEILERCRGQFDLLAFGKPLFDGEKDYRQAALALKEELADYRQPGTEIVLVGHGTDHEAHASYEQFARILAEEEMKDFSVKTVERMEEPIALADDTAAAGHIVLAPLLVVAGMHAVRDIAGDGDASWKSRYERAGYSVDCVMRGLGEYEGIRRIYVRHAKEAEQQAGI